MLLSGRRLTTEWSVGDGREQALAEYVATSARKGDRDDVTRAIDPATKAVATTWG
jgi:catechol O-methyltransferase